MLSVQSVKPMTFRGASFDEDYPVYSKEKYYDDKYKLEGHLDEINSVVDDVNVPKPLRAFGKLIKVGIGAAIGFIGMKFGTQGIIKYGRECVNGIKNFVKKQKVQNTLNESYYVEHYKTIIKEKAVEKLLYISSLVSSNFSISCSSLTKDFTTRIPLRFSSTTSFNLSYK